MSINPTLQHSAFLGQNDFTWWLGTVENSQDRDAKLGRVRVKIFGFHNPDEKPENPPWALVMQPTTNPATGSGNGTQLKPGSFVMGFFLDYPDCQQPVVMGTFYNQIKRIPDPTTQESKDIPSSKHINTETLKTNVTAPPASTQVNDVYTNGAVNESVAASASAMSATNPSGFISGVKIGDGKKGPLPTMAQEITLCVQGLANLFKTAVIYNPTNVTLTADLSKEEQVIPITNSSQFPPFGTIKIGSEIIKYNGKNEYGLLSAVRGCEKGTPLAHLRGASVEWIPIKDSKGNTISSMEGRTHSNNSPIQVVGRYTNKVIDINQATNSCITKISNLITALVNSIKTYIMKVVTEELNKIGLAASNPIPYFVKTVTEVLVQVLKTIGCSLDSSLVAALTGGVEGIINGFINLIFDALLAQASDFIDFARDCVNDIFGSIFEVVSIVTQIVDTVKQVSDMVQGIGGMNFDALFDSAGMINVNMLSNIGNIVGFILQLLGIGCGNSTSSLENLFWLDGSFLDNNCDPFDFRVTAPTIGKWNPEYSKVFVQSSETGSMVLMDDTPNATRFVIEHGPSKTGIHILDNGDVRVTNSNNKTEVTFGKQQVFIKGDAHTTVDGNYNLKVTGNYHLEVDGDYNLNVTKESIVTYSGEHETIYSLDSKLSASNGLVIAASKLGLSASGQLDLYAPTYSTFCTEQNHLCTGSYNRFSLYDNNFVGLNKLKLVGANNFFMRSGANNEIGVGISNKFQSAIDNIWNGGILNSSVIGIHNINSLSIKNLFTTGVTTDNKLGSIFEKAIGLKLCSNTGLLFNNANGASLDFSAAFKLDKAPVVIHA